MERTVKPVRLTQMMALAPLSVAARQAAFVMEFVTVSSMWGCMVLASWWTRDPQPS